MGKSGPDMRAHNGWLPLKRKEMWMELEIELGEFHNCLWKW